MKKGIKKHRILYLTYVPKSRICAKYSYISYYQQAKNTQNRNFPTVVQLPCTQISSVKK